MKRPLAVLAAGVLLLGGFGYVYRTPIRDWWDVLNAPELPAPIRKLPPVQPKDSSISVQDASPVEGGVATSQHFTLVSNPPKPKVASVDPLDAKLGLPAEINLDIPFTSQAPDQNWDMPYQEACEEASAIMVDAYYKGQSGVIAKEAANAEIKRLVAYEEKTLGRYTDTSAQETADWMKAAMGYDDIRVLPVRNEEDIQRALANGYPVMMPFDGKKLPNPNFHNGGPVYHMLVVKGYSKGRFITNDPGTRKGRDFTYSFSELLQAAHDWTGSAADGKSVMIIVMPRSNP